MYIKEHVCPVYENHFHWAENARVYSFVPLPRGAKEKFIFLAIRDVRADKITKTRKCASSRGNEARVNYFLLRNVCTSALLGESFPSAIFYIYVYKVKVARRPATTMIVNHQLIRYTCIHAEKSFLAHLSTLHFTLIHFTVIAQPLNDTQ